MKKEQKKAHTDIDALRAENMAVFRVTNHRLVPFRSESVREGADWYVFTQFEALGARRAYPCFDEPDSKVPWQITLEVPHSLVAVSNTPVAATDEIAEAIEVVRISGDDDRIEQRGCRHHDRVHRELAVDVLELCERDPRGHRSSV